jgi:hypothetical protein
MHPISSYDQIKSNKVKQIPNETRTTPVRHAAAGGPATLLRFRTLPSPSVIAFSSPVSAPPPRTRERVELRDRRTISTESILDTDGGLRPRGIGEDGGDAALLPDDAALRGLASERRLRRVEGARATGAPERPALLLPASLSGSPGISTRTRACAGIDVAAAAEDLGFARALPLLLALALALPLPLRFWPSSPTPCAISAMPVSSVTTERQSS